MTSQPEIKWPGGSQAFPKAALALGGFASAPSTALVAIDPATGRGESVCALAIWLPNEATPTVHLIATRGATNLAIGLKSLTTRIQEIVGKLRVNGLIIAVEELRGSMVHAHLHWAAGAAVTAAASAIDTGYIRLLEVPIRWWKAVAAVTPGYQKGDANDAVAIGETVRILTGLSGTAVGGGVANAASAIKSRARPKRVRRRKHKRSGKASPK